MGDPEPRWQLAPRWSPAASGARAPCVWGPLHVPGAGTLETEATVLFCLRGEAHARPQQINSQRRLANNISESLAESAAAYTKATARKCLLEKVEVITGEEAESNVLQVRRVWSGASGSGGLLALRWWCERPAVAPRLSVHLRVGPLSSRHVGLPVQRQKGRGPMLRGLVAGLLRA